MTQQDQCQRKGCVKPVGENSKYCSARCHHLDSMVHDRTTIMGFLTGYKQTNDGLAPALRETMAACGVTSTSVMRNILRGLQREGKIRLPKAGKTGVKIVGGLWASPEQVRRLKAGEDPYDIFGWQR